MAKDGKILNYTTEVPVIKTIREIEDILAKADASAIVKLYKDGTPTGIEFDITTKFGQRTIRLPTKMEAIYKIWQLSLDNRDRHRVNYGDYARQTTAKSPCAKLLKSALWWQVHFSLSGYFSSLGVTRC